MRRSAAGCSQPSTAQQSSPGLTAAPAQPPNGIAGDALVRHLYVHLPFCAHRCGYCDFVTLVGRHGQHAAYVDGLLAELELERELLAPELETVFLGGGTPTFTEPRELERLLATLPDAAEVTVEANPDTVTPALAALLLRNGVNRVSLGAQTFQPELLGALDRVAGPDDIRRAFYHLRDAGCDNISLDLIYGIPGQRPSDLEADIDEALALRPEHLSCYELEAKPGTRFTHTHGEELSRQGEAMEGYFGCVVETLGAAGYRWYETANFCDRAENAGGRDLRSRHNLAYWRGRDYLGLGIGAVSTVRGQRWRTTPRLGAYLDALGEGRRPLREVEQLTESVQREERVMLGLRLDEPLPIAGVAASLDSGALARLEQLGLARRVPLEDVGLPAPANALTLTSHGRLLGDAVTADLLA
jgi:putative oxygen-independent coproporphyrinogen III oxidase